jgi:hypothetical protein
MFYTDSKVEGAEAKASDGAVVLVAAAAQGKGKDMAVWGFGHAAVPCRYGKWQMAPTTTIRRRKNAGVFQCTRKPQRGIYSTSFYWPIIKQ